MSREQRDQIVNNIHTETLRLNSLASSFLDLARLESGRVQFRRMRFSVADLLYECRDVIMTKAQETNVQIRIDVPNDMPLMEADRDKIKQVVLNLISNAIKYNRPNGSVIVTGNFTDTELLIVIQDLLDQGLSREMARIVLPLNVYTEVVWQMDLNNLLKFFSQRLDPHAQFEIREYAQVILSLISPIVSATIHVWEEMKKAQGGNP